MFIEISRELAMTVLNGREALNSATKALKAPNKDLKEIVADNDGATVNGVVVFERTQNKETTTYNKALLEQYVDADILAKCAVVRPGASKLKETTDAKEFLTATATPSVRLVA